MYLLNGSHALQIRNPQEKKKQSKIDQSKITKLSLAQKWLKIVEHSPNNVNSTFGCVKRNSFLNKTMTFGFKQTTKKKAKQQALSQQKRFWILECSEFEFCMNMSSFISTNFKEIVRTVSKSKSSLDLFGLTVVVGTHSARFLILYEIWIFSSQFK